MLTDYRDVLDVLLLEVCVINQQEPACLPALRVDYRMVEQIELPVMVHLDDESLVETLCEGVNVYAKEEVRHQVGVEVIHYEGADAVLVGLCTHLRSCREEVGDTEKARDVD